MKKLPVALQLYSVRDALAADFLGTLKAVKAMGYDGVEFAGLHGNSFAQVDAWCKEVGLQVVSAHVPFNDLLNNGQELIAGYKALGAKQVVIPSMPKDLRPESGNFDQFMEGTKKIGEMCKAQGMLLGYHNHDFEFQKIGDQYVLDVLYQEVSSDLLQTQIDTCWANVGGVNPSEYVLQYAGRVYTVHIKDFVGQKNDNMYALIGVKDDAEKKAATQQEFELRPVGYGVQDVPAILKASARAGAEWVIVEQDRPSMEKTPMECAELSITYLHSL